MDRRLGLRVSSMVVASICMGLLGCGKRSDTASAPPPTSADTASSAGNANGPGGACDNAHGSVAQINCMYRAGNNLRAAEATRRGAAQLAQVNCFGVAGQHAPPGSPPDDVLGVRGGMEPAAAIKTLQCQKPAYMVQPEGVGNSFGQMAMPDGTMSKTGFRAEIPGSYPPSDRVEVAYVGLPGKEVVAGVARQVDFPPGQQSKYDDLRSGLISKYGQPTDTQDNQYSTRLFWLRGPDGKGLSQASDRHTFCMNESNSGGSFSSTPDCGLVIVALINRSNDNPSAVQHFEIGTVDEAKVYSIADQASTYVKNLRGSGGTTPKL